MFRTNTEISKLCASYDFDSRNRNEKPLLPPRPLQKHYLTMCFVSADAAKSVLRLSQMCRDSRSAEALLHTPAITKFDIRTFHRQILEDIFVSIA